jgi:hypothetical protein
VAPSAGAAQEAPAAFEVRGSQSTLRINAPHQRFASRACLARARIDARGAAAVARWRPPGGGRTHRRGWGQVEDGIPNIRRETASPTNGMDDV